MNIDNIKTLYDLDVYLDLNLDLKHIFNMNSFRIVNFSHVLGAKRLFIEYDTDFYNWALNKKYINNNYCLHFNDSKGLNIFKDEMQDIAKEYKEYIFKLYLDLSKDLKVNNKKEKINITKI